MQYDPSCETIANSIIVKHIADSFLPEDGKRDTYNLKDDVLDRLSFSGMRKKYSYTDCVFRVVFLLDSSVYGDRASLQRRLTQIKACKANNDLRGSSGLDGKDVVRHNGKAYYRIVIDIQVTHPQTVDSRNWSNAAISASPVYQMARHDLDYLTPIQKNWVEWIEYYYPVINTFLTTCLVVVSLVTAMATVFAIL